MTARAGPPAPIPAKQPQGSPAPARRPSPVRVSKPTDPFEREADRLADRLTNITGSTVMRQPAGGGGGGATPGPPPERLVPGPGRPLEAGVREWAEPALGCDLSHVRVHTGPPAGSLARSLGSRAYTTGSHIVFGAHEYRPHSWRGRRLLAHELAHTVQGGDGEVRRDVLPSVAPVDAGLPGGTPLPGPDPDAPAPPEPLEGRVEDVGSDVVLVLISCADRLINFRTPTDNYTYRLTSCRIPVGTYQTTIERHGDDVEFKFGEAVPEGEVFRFPYYVAPGRTNPSTLFETGDTATIQVVESLAAGGGVAQPGCALRLDDREVFGRWAPDPIDIFPSFERSITLWSRTLPLGKFGWVDLTLTASASGSSGVDMSAGPGWLRDICILQRIDDRRIGGTAAFEARAGIAAWLELTGGLDFSARYLSILPALDASGRLEARGEAAFQGLAEAALQVIYDHDRDRWSVTAAVGLEAEADLRFRLTAHALIEALTVDLWREDWTLVDQTTGFAWRGGLRIGPHLGPGPAISADAGAVGALAAPGAPATAGPGTSGGSGMSIDQAVGVATDILEAVLDYDAGEKTSEDEDFEVTGARAKPIPMIWYKPEEEYPRSIILPDEQVFRFGARPRDYVLPDPELVRSGDGAADLRRMPAYQQNGVVRIGVVSANIPTQQRVDRDDPGLIWQKNRSYREALGAGPQRAFRFFLSRHGVDLTGLDADHVRDLQFAGSDDFDNMWPLNSSVNRSSLRFAEQEVTYNDATGAIRRTTLDDPALRGKWFRIVGFHLF